MAINPISAIAQAAAAMFREAVQVTGAMIEKMRGAMAGVRGLAAGITFAGNVSMGSAISTPSMGGAGPPGRKPVGRG